MNTFTIVRPYLLPIKATDLNTAVKNFTKMYYNMKINELIIKDRMNYYKANLKYFTQNNKKRVGIRVFPHMMPVVHSTTPFNHIFLSQQRGNVVRRDGTIQEYNYSPSMMISHTVDHKKDDNTYVVSPPLSPLPFGPMGVMGPRFGFKID